ncbi:hypothetical protein ABIB73_004799 [Bradyrhizobium sp. F1.4.3]|uniref:hypothetical protein n=1 Tax=Bradyrhizobium sp. F1.4.3 TaxID=3156356 RepID=UPI00339094C0
MMVWSYAVLLACPAAMSVAVVQPADPVPSWNNGAANKAIADFVARVAAEGDADFAPPSERIATFDNEGML